VVAATAVLVVPVAQTAVEMPKEGQRAAFREPVLPSFYTKAKLSPRYQLRGLSRRLLKT